MTTTPSEARGCPKWCDHGPDCHGEHGPGKHFAQYVQAIEDVPNVTIWNETFSSFQESVAAIERRAGSKGAVTPA